MGVAGHALFRKKFKLVLFSNFLHHRVAYDQYKFSELCPPCRVIDGRGRPRPFWAKTKFGPFPY